MHFRFQFLAFVAVVCLGSSPGFASERVDDTSIDIPDAEIDSRPTVREAERPGTVDDARITVAIKKKFSRVSRRLFSAIEVSVHEGVATLKGTAESLWAQERAGELAQVIRGVRGVIDRISVGPVGKTKDSTIQEQLEHQFREDPVVELKNLDISVKRGVVTLKGQLQSWQEKQSALSVAKMVRGVQAVRDALTVHLVEGRTDSVIRKEIVRRYQFDVWVERPELVKVSVQDGVVTLSGRVRSVYEKHRIAELSRVSGVRDVQINGVEVMRGTDDPMIRSHRPTPTDEGITDAIHRVLAYDPRLALFDIRVSVKHGIVTLKGTVPFLSIKREAEEDVQHTVGVRAVKNQLTVQTSSSMTDQVIRTRIQNAFKHDPVLARFPLSVAVRKGTALLTGTVDSIYERHRAENVSSRIRGVHALQNKIEFATREEEKTDGDIQLDIENQVWWNPYLSEQDIVATVKDGTAILNGSVEHAPQRVIAEQQAFEAGASAVENRLQIKKRASTPDS
ncbi:BON domain-containing protein [Candidatus Nitrospira salsa]